MCVLEQMLWCIRLRVCVVRLRMPLWPVAVVVSWVRVSRIEVAPMFSFRLVEVSCVLVWVMVTLQGRGLTWKRGVLVLISRPLDIVILMTWFDIVGVM